MEEKYSFSVWCVFVMWCTRRSRDEHAPGRTCSCSQLSLPCRADLVITHALEWPSLTVQWLPVRLKW